MRFRLVWTMALAVACIPILGQAQQCTQAQLNTEFMTDPTTRGYVSCASDGNLAGTNVSDPCVLDKLNAPCTGNPSCKTDNILTREAFLETIVDSAELEKLSRSTVANDVARKSQLDWLLNASPMNLAKASWQQKWKNVFSQADSPITNAAIQAAQLKDTPRCDIVCKKSSGCTLDDVSCGLRGTACP